MPVMLSISSDLDRFAARLNDLERKQLPFATALALTTTARLVREDEKAAMRRAFDRPTPFTLNSLYIEPATKAKLVADVHFKDTAPKGTAAGKYLFPQIEGGPRRQKRMERKLGNVIGGAQLVPGRRADLDAYGNLSAGQRTTIMTRLAPGVLGLGRANSGRGKRKAEGYFAILPGQPQGRGGRGGGLPPGIYRVKQMALGRVVEPILVLSRKPARYEERFDFWGVARSSMKRHLATQLPKAMARAIATSRPR